MIAILTPMANPTVEREMRQLLSADFDYVVGRLVGIESDSTERLRAYAEELPRALAQFGGMPLAAVAFACTASSYLVGREGENRIEEAVAVPVLWAARAISDNLSARGITRLAVVSPYPEAIHRAGLDYWRAGGFEIVSDERVEIGSGDTRAIYDLTSSSATTAVRRACGTDVDLVLLSGTGMPTLDLTDPDGIPPIVSSNLCLALAMQAHMETAR